MNHLKDLTGQKFNRLTVISRAENTADGHTRWNCICDCGNHTVVKGSNLKSGAVKSCGCLNCEKLRYNHNKSKTKEYSKWVSMKRRCYDETDIRYVNYGKRGIKVCDEWLNDFNAFYNWIIETRNSSSLTLERIDVNGDYCPENCTWADAKTQSNNRRTNLRYTYNGETHTLAQWCEKLSLHYGTIHSRIYRNKWTFEDAITTPVISNK